MENQEQPKHRLPNQPFYLSSSEDVNIKWGDNFATVLPVLGLKYGVPTDLIAKVTANNKVLKSIGDYDTLLGTWMTEWRNTKNALMYEPSSEGVIALPTIREEFPVLPPAVAANLFAPFIQAANIILANKALTPADRTTLGLVKAAGKPVPPNHKKRVRADEFNYPLMKFTFKNGVVQIKITRGTIFKGRALLLQVDKSGMGNFTNLINTTGTAVTEAVVLPNGVHTASWTFRGVYVDGNSLLSDWSPNQYLSVNTEPSPFEPEGEGE